jgi:hypothetical protein
MPNYLSHSPGPSNIFHKVTSQTESNSDPFS